ncbi:MAG: hypothetical protein GF383_09315 [Candidatus Lokiarchaeota archaeon]|nr:hypothetical protein [Candidatus Lokiarchaeota archaeon]
MTRLTNSAETSSAANRIIKIKNEILRSFNPKFTVKEQSMLLQELFEFLQDKPEKYVVKAILELVEMVEDPEIFMKINIFIQEVLNLNPLVFEIYKTLRDRRERDDYFYRLLMIYQGFFYSGYILEKTFPELIRELKVDMEEYYRYISNFSESILEDISLEEREHISEKLDIENLIEEITPFRKNTPGISDDQAPIFNFPEHYPIELDKHIKFLNNIIKSPADMKEFVNSRYRDFEVYFDTEESKRLMRKVERSFFKGRYPEALVNMNKLIRKKPKNAVAHYFKGKVLDGMEKKFEAFKSIIKSLELDPLKIDTYENFVYLLEFGGYFHSSFILSTLMIQIFPFDFNFSLQLAISADTELLGNPIRAPKNFCFSIKFNIVSNSFPLTSEISIPGKSAFNNFSKWVIFLSILSCASLMSERFNKVKFLDENGGSYLFF